MIKMPTGWRILNDCKLLNNAADRTLQSLKFVKIITCPSFYRRGIFQISTDGGDSSQVISSRHQVREREFFGVFGKWLVDDQEVPVIEWNDVVLPLCSRGLPHDAQGRFIGMFDTELQHRQGHWEKATEPWITDWLIKHTE